MAARYTTMKKRLPPKVYWSYGGLLELLSSRHRKSADRAINFPIGVLSFWAQRSAERAIVLLY